MSRRGVYAVALSVGILLPAGLAAQNDAGEKQGPEKGVLAGHVVFADTRMPARLAQVMLVKLVPAGAKTLSADEAARMPLKKLVGGCGLDCITTTGLDGRFEMPEVPAGRYVVLAGQNGAVNPLARLDLGVLNAAGATEVSEDQIKPVQEDVTVVTVEAGKAADVVVSIRHGAALSGTLSYDDGSPAVGVRVHLLSRTKAGEFAEPNLLSLGGASSNATLMGYVTDDQGRFRIAGLPPGQYALRAEVPLDVVKNLTKNLKGILTMGMAAPGMTNSAAAFGSMMGDGLSVYSGSVLRKKDLKPLELAEDEQRTGADITIPLEGMHTVAVRVVDAATGHGLGTGRVLLLDAEGKETLRAGFVDEEGNCAFEYVPEGAYTVRAANVMDTSQMGKMLDPGFDPKKAVRYASTETRVQVSGDVSGLLLQVSRAEEKSKEAR